MSGFDLGFTKVPLSFRIGVPASGGVCDDISNRELENSDFQDQMERTMMQYNSTAT